MSLSKLVEPTKVLEQHEDMTMNLSKKRMKLVEEVMSNEDLLLQVLLCLPAKSLVRFKSVSKSWFFLICDPKFCSKHTQLNPKSPALGIYFAYYRSSDLRSVSFEQSNRNDLPTFTFINNTQPSICHACNGLFLCYNNVASSYFVCNITTRTSIVIPQHPLPPCGYKLPTISSSLVFDPSKSLHFKVVVVDEIHRDHESSLHSDEGYKRISDNCNHSCYGIDVYSSETGVWERMYFRAPAQSARGYLHYRAVFDGTLHLITKDKFHLRFEVDAAKLTFIPLPPKPKMNLEKIRYFGECSGHLFLAYVWSTTKAFNVFELDTAESNWTMKYSVDMGSLVAAFPDCQWPRLKWNFSVLCVVKDEKTNDFALLMALPDKIVSYNLNRKTIKVLDESPMQGHPLQKHSYAFARTLPFMASLSLV